jgi:hypothetical protein
LINVVIRLYSTKDVFNRAREHVDERSSNLEAQLGALAVEVSEAAAAAWCRASPT